MSYFFFANNARFDMKTGLFEYYYLWNPRHVEVPMPIWGSVGWKVEHPHELNAIPEMAIPGFRRWVRSWTIPRFVASPDDCEMQCYGTGNTPSEAIAQLIVSSEWEEYIEYLCLKPSDTLPVYVFNVVRPEDSSWPEDYRDPDWIWVAEGEEMTVTVRVGNENS